MNEQEAIGCFRAQLITATRALPLGAAINVLRGALAIAPDHESMVEVRGVYRRLVVADAQLEQLADPQAPLPSTHVHGNTGGSAQ